MHTEKPEKRKKNKIETYLIKAVSDPTKTLQSHQKISVCDLYWVSQSSEGVRKVYAKDSMSSESLYNNGKTKNGKNKRNQE